jgi:polysaccharide biosynthesis/export protein
MLRRRARFVFLGAALLLPSLIFAQTDQQSSSKPSADSTPAVSPAQDAATPEPTRAGRDYVIGKEDVLQISVFNVPGLTQTVRVADDGMISLPLLGQVKATGYTATQLQKELETEYGKTYLQDPQISVYITEFQADPVSVIGAVGHPGIYYLRGPRRLIDMLSMAGGLAKRSENVPGKSVIVTRPGGFEDILPQDGLQILSMDKVEIDLKKLLYSGDEGLNIAIKPNDVIAVNKAGVVYVLGEVTHPGGFVLEDRSTLSVMQALAMAGGLTPNAKRQEARIVQVADNGARTQVPVNLEKVLDQKAPDPSLSANDILYVPDSKSRAAIRRGVDSAIATISGILIFHP